MDIVATRTCLLYQYCY